MPHICFGLFEKDPDCDIYTSAPSLTVVSDLVEAPYSIVPVRSGSQTICSSTVRANRRGDT